MTRVAALLCSSVLLFAACGDSDDSTVAAGSPSTTAPPTPSTTAPGLDPVPAADAPTTPAPLPAVTGALGEKPSVTVGAGVAPVELVVEDITQGSGAEAVAGLDVSVQYVGVSHATGEQFDASWDRGQPFSFTLGTGQVITGWDQGVEGMKAGGRRLLVIPPDLAYGESGSGSGSIGPNETLVFVVDLVDVYQPPPQADPAAEPEVPFPDAPPTDLVIDDLVVGTGDSVEAGDEVVLNYVGAALSTREVFDSSWEGGHAVAVQVGIGRLIPGWDQGVVGMREGGRRVLVIPPELAYGDDGVGPIGPNETLVFVVDVIEVRR